MGEEADVLEMQRLGNQEIGYGSRLGFMGRYEERYLTDLQGPEGMQAMAEILRKESAAYAAHQLVMMTAGSAEWDVEPASDDAADEDAAAFLRSIMDDMSHSWGQFVRDAMSCIAFGFADVEIVWKRRDGREPTKTSEQSKYDDGLVGVRKLAFRRQETVDSWEEDEHGGVQAMNQRVPKAFGDTVVIPIEKLLHFIGGDDRGGWEGIGWLEPGYKLVHMIENYEIIEGVGWQRSFVGLPVFTPEQLPTDADKRTAVVNAMKRMGKGLVANSQQYVITEPGIKFELLSVANTNGAEIRVKINQLRWELSALVFATVIRMGIQNVGTEALSRTVQELFEMGVDSALGNIADVLNRHLVPRLFGYNVGAFAGMTDYPQIAHSSVHGTPTGFLPALDKVSDWLERAPEGDSMFLRNYLGMPALGPDKEWQAAPEPPAMFESKPTDLETEAMLLSEARKLRRHREPIA